MASIALPSRTRRLARRLGLLSLHRLWVERRRLADLDPHILRDIGLTEAEAAREARRPVWDVPAHWRG